MKHRRTGNRKKHNGWGISKQEKSLEIMPESNIEHSAPDKFTQLEAALAWGQKEREFKKQHGVVKVIMKDGKLL